MATSKSKGYIVFDSRNKERLYKGEDAWWDDLAKAKIYPTRA